MSFEKSNDYHPPTLSIELTVPSCFSLQILCLSFFEVQWLSSGYYKLYFST